MGWASSEVIGYALCWCSSKTAQVRTCQPNYVMLHPASKPREREINYVEEQNKVRYLESF